MKVEKPIPFIPEWSIAVERLFPQDGSQWLQDLPKIVESCVQAWGLRLRPPQRESVASYIIPVERDDGQWAMLKCGLPNNPEFLSEAHALAAFDGRGAVRLVEVDYERGAMLIERATPAQPLSLLEDDGQATQMAGVLMQRLWRPSVDQVHFPSLEKWAQGFNRLRLRYQGSTGPLSEALVGRAERLYGELLQSSSTQLLLHGDLHHTNIVSSQREAWLAIDPKGVIGDPAFETAALLYNPIPFLRSHPNPKYLLIRRVDILADVLGFARRRIWDWAVAQGMLSAVWCIEDGVGDWEYWQSLAELMDSIG